MGLWKGGKTLILAHNKMNLIDTVHQPGGCMMTLVNKAKGKIISCGADPRKLG